MKRIFQNVILMNIRISIILFLFISPVLATETTVYLGSIEKTIETEEIKVYIPAGNAVVVKSIKGTTSYLYSDHLGSTSLVTDELGNKTESYLYYPFGNTFNLNQELGIRNQGIDKLYTGQRKDESSDLYFYNARYYNPNIGNFISADKAQGPNRYSYVGNNPIMRNDPTGNCFLGIIGSDCNLPSYARYATKEEQNQSASTVSNYGLQASLLGAFAFLADQNIPVVSGISGSYAKAADEIITGSITNNSSLYTLGGMDLMTSVAEAYTAGVTAYGYASLGKSFYNYYLSPEAKTARLNIQSTSRIPQHGDKATGDLSGEGPIFKNEDPFSDRQQLSTPLLKSLQSTPLTKNSLNSHGGVIIENDVFTGDYGHNQLIRKGLNDSSYQYTVGKSDYPELVLNRDRVADTYDVTTLFFRRSGGNHTQFMDPTPLQIRKAIGVLNPDYINLNGYTTVNPFRK